MAFQPQVNPGLGKRVFSISQLHTLVEEMEAKDEMHITVEDMIRRFPEEDRHPPPPRDGKPCPAFTELEDNAWGLIFSFLNIYDWADVRSTCIKFAGAFRNHCKMIFSSRTIYVDLLDGFNGCASQIDEEVPGFTRIAMPIASDDYKELVSPARLTHDLRDYTKCLRLREIDVLEPVPLPLFANLSYLSLFSSDSVVLPDSFGGLVGLKLTVNDYENDDWINRLTGEMIPNIRVLSLIFEATRPDNVVGVLQRLQPIAARLDFLNLDIHRFAPLQGEEVIGAQQFLDGCTKVTYVNLSFLSDPHLSKKFTEIAVPASTLVFVLQDARESFSLSFERCMRLRHVRLHQVQEDIPVHVLWEFIAKVAQVESLRSFVLNVDDEMLSHFVELLESGDLWPRDSSSECIVYVPANYVFEEVVRRFFGTTTVAEIFWAKPFEQFKEDLGNDENQSRETLQQIYQCVYELFYMIA